MGLGVFSSGWRTHPPLVGRSSDGEGFATRAASAYPEGLNRALAWAFIGRGRRSLPPQGAAAHVARPSGVATA
eukprot:11203086-Lingulodinium_polyedra.AAC.1